MKITAFILALALLPLEARKPVKVSCIGDSITYGMKLENRERDSYPAQLQHMLGDGYLVGNFGKSGATLLRHGHRPYMEQEEFAQALDFAGDILVIHLGINDTDPRDWPVCGEDFVGDYLALIDSLKSRNPKARVLIARMTPIGDTHPRFRTGTKQYHGEIQQAIEEVVRLSGAQMIDFYEPLCHFPWMLPDAVHPTAEGATILARAACQGITGKYGGLQMPAWYSDNMVLPREKRFPIKGWADTGEKVTVRLLGKRYQAVAGTDGRWEVAAGPLPATLSTPLVISTKNRTLRFENVALGDIWLASGQSNMEFQLQQCATADDAASADDAGLRLLDIPCNWRTDDLAWSPEAVDSVQRLQYFKPAHWTRCTPGTAARFSAIGYYFGKQLRDSLQVPVGIICNAVGGSTAESWTDREQLETHFPEILKDWQHNALIMEWARERAAKNLSLGTGSRHPYEPCYLWESGILPLKDCPITGVIWYQGESNADNIPAHERLFPLLVDSWRSVFGPVPFYYAQLSSLNRPSWPAFRRSQARLAYSRPRLSMIVTEDLGEWEQVHYKRKKPAGERFAAMALSLFYGRKKAFSDTFEDATLFQEWTETEEATIVQKSFENSLPVPFPKKPVLIEVSLLDTHGQVSGYLRHPLNPEDILIRPLSGNSLTSRVIHEGGGYLSKGVFRPAPDCRMIDYYTE